MSKSNNYAELLFDMIKEYVDAWNEEAKRQELPNTYKFFIEDGDKPLKYGSNTIKYYKTAKFTLSTGEDEFLLYISHCPLKNVTEASRSKNWLLRLVKDFLFQCFTNYSVMSHASILEKEQKLRKEKQIGNMVGLDGKPLVKD